jgi:outer membrane protein OmpA-like peptidoglycan-associated protein
MRSGPRTLLLCSLLAAAAVGCDHRPEDFGPVQASTEAFVTGWTRRISELEARRSAMFERAQKLPAEADGLADVLSRLSALKVEIEALERKRDGVGQAATAKVQEKRRRLAEEALASGEKDLNVDLSGLVARLDEVGGQLDAVAQAADVKAKEPAAPVPPPPFDDPAFARGPHRADVSGIAFKAGQLDLAIPSTQPALDRVLAFAKQCDELRFGITGHTAKDGDAKLNQRLSEAQAHAVRKHLIGNGVDAKKIVQVAGVAGVQPALDEPEPGSPEEAAMRPQELARIRNVNRRISIQVIEPCK